MLIDNLTLKVNGESLTDEQLKKVTIFILNFSHGFSRLVFRGENENNLRRKLNIGPTEDFLAQLLYFIFMLGDKARIYQQEYRDHIRNECEIYPISTVDEPIYNMIFRKFNHIFYTSTNVKITNFKKNNSDFVAFFQNKENKNVFLSAIREIPNDRNKLVVRDYYLYLLHKIGVMGFYFNSFLVSATRSKKIADQFAGIGNNKQEAVTFVGWKSKEIYQHGIIKKYLLPAYNRTVYSGQMEIPLKGGILPHYLLGVIIHKTNEFIINPNFFTTTKDIDYIIKYGMDIDQERFREILEQTNYAGYVTLDGDENWRDYRL